MIFFHGEHKISLKAISLAESGRESDSHQTHIGLNAESLTFLVNRYPVSQKCIFCYNDVCQTAFANINMINDERSPKLIAGSKEPSVNKLIRSITSVSTKQYYLLWFALADETIVFWLFDESHQLYSVYNDVLERGGIKTFGEMGDLLKLAEIIWNNIALKTILLSSVVERKGCCVQKILFGAPGTGKSYEVEHYIRHSVNVVDSKVVSSQFEKYLNDKLLKDGENESKKKESVLRLKACVDSELLGSCYSKIVGVPFFKLSECIDIPTVEKLSKLLKEEKKGETFLFKKGTFGNALTALKYYISFLKENNQLIPKQRKTVQEFRTTFHPDYDYAQFVGSYKPKKDGNVVTYEFVPQVFAKAYESAYKNPDAMIYLVVEEINRGNCAQIFGDIFQLLDRKNGVSEYAIEADADFGDWLTKRGVSSQLRLPANLNILATMNTSDQSLFPMDSAFKRRFDWKYVPIDYNQPKADFIVDLGDGKTFSWLKFLKLVNDDIYEVTKSEDKQMGEFFIKPLDGVIKLEDFCSKVLFYLWDSVYKDETSYDKVFHFKHPKFENKTVTFQSLFVEDQKYAVDIISQMIDNLEKEASSDEKIKDNGNFVDLLASRNSVAEDVVEEESSDEAVETVVEEDLPEQD